ncbi:serine hydrolase domain-containing protein [Silvibacterium dinghuense]|nr:serine hydrolase domain-containing protein [Silvibacterium dinghuense]GGH13322.1 D-alanyl-D-alanine carboxypeptidase [Silvibacterium dinghuense]
MTALREPIPESAAAGRTRFAAARALLEQAVTEQAFPGAAYGLLYQGEVLALDAVGRFTYEPDSPAVMHDTIYDLASVSKVMATTAIAMWLYDRRRLDLDLALGEVLPGFVVGGHHDPRRVRVTLRHLLAHASGLPGYGRLFEQNGTPSAMMRAALEMPLEAEPGTRVEYSDIGFMLLGKALEVLAGESLDALFAREIAAPLGLGSARYNPPQDWRSLIPPTELDTWYRHRAIQGEVQDENCHALGGVSGHAGLFAHVQDVLRFAACMLAGGRTSHGGQLFSGMTVDLFSARQPEPPGTSRALGWDTPSQPSSSGNYFGPHSIGHLGYAGTSLWIDRDRSLAAVLLTNRTWPNRQTKAIQQVRPRFHDALLEAVSASD